MKIALILNSPHPIAQITEENIVCADGGYRHIQDITPIAIVGDFDSLNRLSTPLPKMIRIIEHPVEKNCTDGELALRYCVDNFSVSEIIIYGALGGKLEHILGNLALLKIAKELGISAKIKEKTLEIFLIDKDITLSTNKGDSVSVLPYGGKSTVLSSEGLYYPLTDLPLSPDDTRGISNVATGEKIHLAIKCGEVLVLHYFGKNN